MDNNKLNYELIKFVEGEFSLDLKADYKNKTLWLTQKDMALLFGKSRTTIAEHINSLFGENSLKSMTYAGNTNISNHRPSKLYNLDVVIAVGYHVKSNRIAKFKEWCDSLFSSLTINNKYGNIPISSAKDYELVEFKDGDFSLDVNVSPNEDTVWLTQSDIALLFETTKQNVSLHIKNILTGNELDISVVKDFFTTAQDGKLYQVKMYNLDMIIAIGYRVNSRKGTLFRRWANSVLKEYLFNGFSINKNRCLTCTTNIINLQNEVNTIRAKVTGLENKVNLDNSKIIYEGELLDAYTFLRKLFFLAKDQLVITDPYADKFLLSMLVDIKVNITIITSTNSYINNLKTPDNMKIISDDNLHGRYIFIDDDFGYILDNSINNIANKRTIIMKLDDKKEQILKGIM